MLRVAVRHGMGVLSAVKEACCGPMDNAVICETGGACLPVHGGREQRADPQCDVRGYPPLATCGSERESSGELGRLRHTRTNTTPERAIRGTGRRRQYEGAPVVAVDAQGRGSVSDQMSLKRPDRGRAVSRCGIPSPVWQRAARTSSSERTCVRLFWRRSAGGIGRVHCGGSLATT